MEGETREEPVRDLNELQNSDWVRRPNVKTLTVYFYHTGETSADTFVASSPGSLLGAGDARSSKWGEVKESTGATVQPAAHRVPAHAVRDAHGRHSLQTIQAEKSHGQSKKIYRIFTKAAHNTHYF